MTIEQLGSLGEFVAAIATVATLLYLAIQIRQSNAANRLASAVAQTQTEMSVSLLLAQDAELNRIYFDGLADPGSIDERERMRLNAFINAFLTQAQQTWLLHREGAISEDQWRSSHTFLVWLVHQPAFSEHWRRWRAGKPDGFAQVVDAAIAAESPIPVDVNAGSESRGQP